MKNRYLIFIVLFTVLFEANCSNIGIGSTKQTAENLGKNELGKYLVNCEASFYLDRLTSGPFELKKEGLIRLREIPLSEADKLNGFEYMAVLSYDYVGPQREFSGYANGWGQWEQGTQTIDIEILCKAGKWQVNKSGDLFRGAAYKELSCGAKSLRYPLAIEAFRKGEDSKSVPTMIELWTDILQSVKDKNRFGDPYDKRVIQEAVRMLAMHQKTNCLGLLCDTLHSCDSRYEEVGKEIIDSLGELKKREAVPTLIWAIPKSKKWVSNISDALIKLGADESQGALKDILRLCIEKECGAYMAMGGLFLSDIGPYLNTLSVFSGKPWNAQNWGLVINRLRELNNLHRSAQGIISSFDKNNYDKAAIQLRNITGEAHYDKIRDWVFPIKNKDRPSFGGSGHQMKSWTYGEISSIELEDDGIRICLSRHRPGRSDDILDYSNIILKHDGANLILVDIFPMNKNLNPDPVELPSK